MKIQYRERTLVEQMTDAIASASQPIDYFELSQTEFQSVFNELNKIKSGNTVSYSFKGIQVKVVNE